MIDARRYRKKPVVIEAVKWPDEPLGWPSSWVPVPFELDTSQDEVRLRIPTLEGDMYADQGDYIVRGVKGEFYPVKPDIFEATYEPVEDADG